MGPYLVFDKSFLESLTLDESVWLDNFFASNITPIFYIESLADLEKSHKSGRVNRTPEDIVKEIARKTPVLNSIPAMFHLRLILGNLLGQEVEMTIHHRPIIGGGEYKKSSDGELSIDYKQFPEFAALERWRRYEFTEIERDIAKNWRMSLSSPNFELMISKVKSEITQELHFSKMEDIKRYVDNAVKSKYNQFIRFAFDLLAIPEKPRKQILRRWYDTRPMPFSEFAPYAAYILSLNMFFYLCLDKSFISPERPSNLIDLSYLYYLPFCSVFVSNDKLHSRVVPLFLGSEQTFVQGKELKDDFKKLNEYYQTLPDKTKALGTFKFAAYPPLELDTLVGKLYDKHLRPWRKNAKAYNSKLFDPVPQDRKLFEKLNKNKIPYKGKPVSSDQVDSMTITHKVLVSRGSWRILPVGIENKVKS